MVTNGNAALFCTDNRLRQAAIFLFAKVGKGRLSSYVKDFEIKKKLFSVAVSFFIL